MGPEAVEGLRSGEQGRLRRQLPAVWHVAQHQLTARRADPPSTDALAFLFEQNTWHHWVPTNPAFKWPADLPESWNGASIGRWDGDTLVIETTGFNGYTRLDTHGPSAQQAAETDQHVPADRFADHAAHGDRPRSEGLHAGVDERADLEHEASARRADGILVRGEQPPAISSSGAIKLWKPPEDID